MIEFNQDEDRLLVVLPFGNRSIVLGNIDSNGFSPTDNIRLAPETLKVVATKAKEVREWGVNPEPCSECKGTPYFPNGNCSSPRHLEFY